MHPIIRSLIAAVLMTGASAGNLIAISQLDFAYDANLVNSPSGNTSLSSYSLHTSQRLDWALRERRKSQLNAGLFAQLSQPLQYAEMTSAMLEGSLTFNAQPKLGFNQPWYQARWQNQLFWHRFEQYRRVGTRLNVTRFQNMTDRLLLTMGAAVQGQIGNEDAYRGGQVHLSSGLSWQLDRRQTLYTHLQAGYGRIVTSYSGTLNSRAHHLPEESLASPDTVSNLYFLDDGVSEMLDKTWYGYGVDGVLGRVLIGYNRRLSQRWTLDIAYSLNLAGFESAQYQRQQGYLSVLFAW